MRQKILRGKELEKYLGLYLALSKHTCVDSKNRYHSDQQDNPAFITTCGKAVWYKHGVIHRDEDKPAVVFKDGSAFWCKNGRLHREGNLPAVINKNGTLEWYVHGKLHRDGDRPAQIHGDFCFDWWKDGKRHRDGDLPSIVVNAKHFKAMYWHKQGKLHRDGDQPAIIYDNLYVAWYRNGKRVQKREKNTAAGKEYSKGT